MPERSLNSTLRTSLLNNDAFAYAHLVKFEKPSLTSQVEGAIAGKATDYAYITDASQDIVFNDGSTDSEGNANGAQTYRANRLISVGTVSETTEARASNMALKLYATTLGTTVEDSLNISSGSLAGTVSFSDEGFREGDKVLLTGGGSNNGKYVIINAFSNAGKTLAVTPVDTTLSTESSATYTLSLASEEITALLLNKSSTGYASFINREVYVYKAHLSAEDNSIIGEPYLLFKGIVSNGSIQEKPDSNSTVTWNLTSHWGDFVQVRGRITSDAFHRALDPTGRPDRDGLIRPEYANDLGFLHSEKAVNLISTYQVKETRYRKQTKSGFLGFNKKISLIPYDVEVDREVDLRFNLQAKYLPVVYGVQRVDSIPFFVDTLVSDPKQVYTGYAISEGEIGGIYDIYIDDTPSICIDQNDYDARSSQTTEQTIDVLCKGRADQGDTLSGASYFSGTFNTGLASNVPGLNDWEIREAGLLGASLTALSGVDFSLLTGTGAQTSGTGITHEKGHSFVTPIDTSLTFHAGKPFQRANSVLAQTASSNSFKIQNDYYDNEADYWGANHRLLDTAYVVSKYTISEGETQIPELDFVVRGKLIDCYNYDYSYSPDLQNDSSHDESLFELLDTVTLHNTTTNSQIGSSVQIIDKWSFEDENGTTQYRFRFSENPSLGSVKRFYMKNTSGDRWYFETYDYSANSGLVRETLDTTITTASNNATSGVDIALSSPTLAAQAAFRFGNSLNLTDGQFDEWYNSEFDYVEDIANNAIQAVGQANAATFNATTAIPANSIALATSASSSTGVYIGYKIRLTRFDAEGVPYVQERTITNYLGSEKVAIVDSKWDAGKTPVQGDTYEILSPGDKRVSINPAMQLLDYLTSPRYGKGLSLEDDISLESFKDTARLCDTRSNVFMQAYSNAITDGVDVGDVFKYVTSTGKTVFQGKVKSLIYHSGPNSTEVEFEEVVGKIARKWENWKTFESGDLYWHQGRLYVASANGKISTPTSNNTQGTTTLTKVSGTGSVTNWQFNTISANFDGNPIVKAYDSDTDRFKKTGYSLYDSDDVKYWRYVGWDAQEQRYVTRHQTNFVIDTAKPVFDNINGMLNHFNGILRYANGRYELDIESSVGVLSEAQYIDTDDIIGEIKITDAGQKGVFNSVSAAIPDPQNRFDNRTVTFFNSQYLKEDRGVPKQGNFNLPGITNYFNARINVKQFLDQSRYSLSINFTMMPKGALLLAGSLVSITYPRFGWTNKLFRISNLNFTSECLAQVTAEEHNNDAYIISGFNKEFYNKYEPAPIITPTPAAPSNLVATDDERGGITLTWNNGSNFNPSTYVTEIWRNSTNDRSSATLLGVTKGTTFLDSVTTEGAVTRYYWIRHSVSVLSQLSSQAAPREIFSPWYPLSATAGESGTSLALLDGINITLSRPVVALASDTEGTVGDFGGSGTDITVTQGTTRFEYDGSASPAANTFSVTATSPSSVVTFDTTPTTVNDGSGNPTIRRYDDISAMSATAGSVVFTVTVNFGNSLSTDFTTTQSFSKVSQGENGIDSRTVNLTVSDQSIEYSSAGINPDPSSVTITATALNTSQTPYYEFFVGGSSVQNTVANSYAYNVPTNYTSLPTTVEVHLREGSNTGTVLARDQITIFGVKPGQSAISAVLSNESHVLFEDENGNVDYTGSGTSIEVFEGNTQLSYDGSVSPANGTFSVNAVPTNITLETSGSPFTSGSARVYKDHTAISADTGSVAYTITATRADGTTETLTRTQSITKVQEGAAARNVTLTVTDQSISYDTNGASPNPDEVTFTATARNMQDTPYYTFFVNGSEVRASSTTATYAYTVPTAFTSLPVQVRVDVREGAADGALVAQDFVTVIGTKPGENAITIVLTNEAHTLPTTTAGVVTYTGSGTDIQVYEGNTQLTVDQSSPYAAGTFRVSANSASTIDVGTQSVPDTYTVRYGPHGPNMPGDTAAVTYTIDVVKADGTTATFTRVQSLSKANQGATGAPGVKTALVYAYQRSASTLTSDAGDVTVDLDSGLITTATLDNGWSKTIPTGSNPLYVIAASAAGTGTTDTVAAAEWSSPVILSQDGAPGSDGLNTATVFIYQRTAANSAPALPIGNTTYTFSSGAASFTNANGWSRSIPSSGGAYLWISQATAAATSSTDTIAQGEWAAAVLLSQDGAPGAAGLRTVQGYLYFEFDPDATGAPGSVTAPSGNTYTFSTGVVSGTGINDAGTINVWKNTPNVQDPTSTNTHYTIRYYGTESSANSSTISVTYSGVVQYTNFSGVVTFSGGTFSEGGTAITTIDGGNISTGTITTEKLRVTGRGSALNSDPNVQDSTAWVKYLGSDASFITITDGEVGNNVIRSGTGGAGSWYNGSEKLALDPSKTYRMTALVRKSATANGTVYVGVAAFDGSDNNISGDGSQWSYDAVSGGAGSTSWTRYTMEFGAGTSTTFPSNAVTFAPLVILNYNSTAGYFEAQDIRIEEMLPASLIVDGAITADKIKANDITTSQLSVGVTDSLGKADTAQQNDSDKTAGKVGGWTVDSTAIFSGTKDTSGYSTNGLTLVSTGGIHTPYFYANTSGAGFKGTVTIGTTDLTALNTLNENTTKDNVGLGNVENQNPSGQLQRSFALTTSISAGSIAVGNITIDGANGRILITD